MKCKNIFSFLCSLAIVASLAVPARAVESTSKTIDLGNGFYAVETIEILPTSRASDIVNGLKKISLYQGSTHIGTTTLGGTFDISGSSAKATAGYITGAGSNGWSYDSGSARCSGNTVYGAATYRSADGTTKSHSGSLSCAPDGTLS